MDGQGSKEFLSFVMDFTKIMTDQKIILSYDGVVSQDIVKAFTSLTERKLDIIEADKKVKKNVFHIMVEYLQNIVKHTDDYKEYVADESEVDAENTSISESHMKSGIFIVGKDDHRYFVTSGNLILNSKISILKYALDNLNLMDLDGLNELYKYKLRDTSISSRGGAGLGFIDIARKAQTPFAYHFEPVNDMYSFFVLTSDVMKREEA